MDGIECGCGNRFGMGLLIWIDGWGCWCGSMMRGVLVVLDGDDDYGGGGWIDRWVDG